MKHIVIIVAMMLGIMWLVRFSTVEDVSVERAALTSTSIAQNFDDVMLLDMQSVYSKKMQNTNVGMLFYSGDNLTSARLRRTLTSSFEELAKLNILYSSGDVGMQMAMFEKMLQSEYSTVIVELVDVNVAENFIDLAKEHDTALIFIGEKPDLRLLQKYDKVYYVGYNSVYFMDAVIGELRKLYPAEELKKNSTINYSVVLSSENAGEIVEQINTSSEFYELPLKNKVTSKITQLNYNLEEELDKIVKSKTELIFFDDPVALKRSLEYFEDREKFPKPPNIKAVMLEYDDNVKEFKSHDSVAMVIGYDDAVLAKITAKLCMLLAQGENPTAELMDLQATDGKAFYIDYSVA